jgi:hypothetical protein
MGSTRYEVTMYGLRLLERRFLTFRVSGPSRTETTVDDSSKLFGGPLPKLSYVTRL